MVIVPSPIVDFINSYQKISIIIFVVVISIISNKLFDLVWGWMRKKLKEDIPEKKFRQDQGIVMPKLINGKIKKRRIEYDR